ncbi:hypothetical protein [Pseudomonas chlororaphis]|uniref:hypothetical protein n=1 Tax=Pseudomonas chlororaphis TaxID=587753 RepID=UPI002367154C|nr:hypothetical protein [Pseudomonas chlororaphis]WDH25786.1 hypothetical protein PUP50_16375 [Pseudomonas chlororaphis]
MVKMNKKMEEALKGIKWEGWELPVQLFDLLPQGFVEDSGCVFLTSLASMKTNATESDFLDRTGRECFVNSVHIDDYVSSDYLVNACLFVEAVFEKWRRQDKNRIFQAVISSDEFGAVVKFHLLRDGEFWVGDNLEGYEDPILLSDSTGVRFC